MKRIVLPDNINDDYLNQNLGKNTCSECGAQKNAERPFKKISELQNEAGIHNFTFKGESGHTRHLYWEHNDPNLRLRVYAVPNDPESHKSDQIDRNYIRFAVKLRGRRIRLDHWQIKEELTVEKYLERIRNYIEKYVVYARNNDGELVEGDMVY